jgi:hypothetical protein
MATCDVGCVTAHVEQAGVGERLLFIPGPGGPGPGGSEPGRDSCPVVGPSFGALVARKLAFLEGGRQFLRPDPEGFARPLAFMAGDSSRHPYRPHGMKVSTGQAVTLGTPVPAKAMQSEARN